MSICDRCIHDEVCGLEDNHEEGIVNCADMIPKDVLDKIRTEIADEKIDFDLDIGQEIHYNRAIDDVLAIIDRYREGENE